MPTTAARRQFIPGAIRCFLEQTYPEKELIILEDGPGTVEDLIPNDPRVKLHRFREQCNIGRKRNICCERAAGQVIMHFDDDDWSAPERMADQIGRLAQTPLPEDPSKHEIFMQRLLATRVPLTGYHTLLFYDEVDGSAWQYCGHRNYACGTSFAYLMSFWRAHRFAAVKIGSDNDLIRRSAASRAGGLEWTVNAGPLMVARAHPGTTNMRDLKVIEAKKFTSWRRVPREKLPALFLKSIEVAA